MKFMYRCIRVWCVCIHMVWIHTCVSFSSPFIYYMKHILFPRAETGPGMTLASGILGPSALYFIQSTGEIIGREILCEDSLIALWCHLIPGYITLRGRYFRPFGQTREKWRGTDLLWMPIKSLCKWSCSSWPTFSDQVLRYFNIRQRHTNFKTDTGIQIR